MNEDSDKIMRSVLFILKTSKNLKTAITAVEAISGEPNVSFVNDRLARLAKEETKDQ